MAEILKPSDINKIWSSGGDIIPPSDTKIQTGWVVEIPPRQWFNWLDNKQDQAIAHINQHGISVWDNLTEYQVGKSYVTGSNGKIYVAVQTNTGNDPVTDGSNTYWTPVFKSGFTTITSTTASWAVPPILRLGIRQAKVTVIGGGGAGGKGANTASRGGGGGGGGVSQRMIDLTGVSTVSVTVGTGGTAASVVGATGGAGTSSSFGAYCSATGGGGGVGTLGGAAGGASGQGAGGDLNFGLGDGTDGGENSSRTGGDGGGAGGRGSSIAAAPGISGKAPGAGGGGIVSDSTTSGIGANGIVIIEW